VNSLLEPDEVVSGNQEFKQEFQFIPFEKFILCHANLNSHLEVARFVQVEGRNMETLTYIQKEINANSESKRILKLKHTRN